MATNLINCSVQGDGVFFTTQQDAGDGPLVMVGGPFSTISTLSRQPWTDLSGFLDAELPVGMFKAIIEPDAGYQINASNFTIGGVQPSVSSYYAFVDPHYYNQGQSVNCYVWINGQENYQGDAITLDPNIDRVLLRNTSGPQNSTEIGSVDPTSPNNRVEVTVILYDTFLMPEESLTINVDIDGAAVPVNLDSGWEIDDETGLVVPDYNTNSPFEVRFIPIRVGSSENYDIFMRRMSVGLNSDSSFPSDSYTFYNYTENPYSAEQLAVIDNRMCNAGLFGSGTGTLYNMGWTDTQFFSTSGWGAGASSVPGTGVPLTTQDNIDGYIVRPFIPTYYNSETNIGIQSYTDEAGSGAYENCVAHARINKEEYGSEGFYGNSIGTSALNGDSMRWQFCTGKYLAAGSGGSPNSPGSLWPKIQLTQINQQYQSYNNGWGWNTWDYISDSSTPNEVLFNVLDVTIRWPMVDTSGNYFYYENYVSGVNSPFSAPVVRLQQTYNASAFSGGSYLNDSIFNTYVNQEAYTNLDLTMNFNSDFVWEPPSQANGYWTLDSPVYVYIFWQGNPILYTASNTENPFGPDEDD